MEQIITSRYTMAPFLMERPISPLMLADRLITLAQDADRAGFPDAASQLVCLVSSVLDGAR